MHHKYQILASPRKKPKYWRNTGLTGEDLLWITSTGHDILLLLPPVGLLIYLKFYLFNRKHLDLEMKIFTLYICSLLTFQIKF